MLRKSGNQLKLNSYKIDTQSLQNSLRELSQMKQTLQTTISHYKSNQDQLLLQNQRLKEQISMLQNKTTPKSGHTDCQQKILKLQDQLKEQRREMEKLKRMNQSQKRSKQIITKQYESKLQKQMTQSKILSDNYQQRLAALSVQLKQAKVIVQLTKSHKNARKQQQSVRNQLKSSKTNQIKKYQNNMRSDSQNQQMLNSKNEKYDNTKTVSENQKQMNKTSFNMPPKSPQQNNLNRQYKTNQQIRNQDKNNFGQNYSYTAKNMVENQSIFLASMRKLYYEVKQLGLSAQQMKVLPQFKKLANNENPSVHDLAAFMKNAPIQQKNQANVQKNANYLYNLVKNKYGKLSGNFVTQMIIAKVEQCQNKQGLNSQDLQFSGSLSKGSVNQAAKGYSSNEDKNYGSSQHQYNSASDNKLSINDNLNMESQYSCF